MEPDVGTNVLIVLSEDEARDLYRFTRHAYISGATYPALSRLVDRVAVYLSVLKKAEEESPDGTSVSR